MATDARSLLQSAGCYLCFSGGNIQQLLLMRLALTKQWATAVDPTINTSPEALLNYARCYICNSNGATPSLFQLQLFRLVLLDDALSAIGGGGQDQGRITEEGVFRDTEEGERRYTEEL